MKRIIRYIKSSIDELKRVIWPTRRQAIQLSIIVIIFTVIIAAYLAILDLGFRTALQRLLTR